MKRFLWLVVIFILLLPQAGAFASNSFQAILSGFPNSSFEIDPADPSNGWEWPNNDWVWDGGIAHSGTHSARIYRASGEETASLYSAYMPVQPSTVYTLSFWMRTAQANKYPSVSIYQYKSDNSQTGLRLIAFANIGDGNSDWHVTDYRFQTMPDTTQVRIRIFLYTDTTGTFWFDDFNLDGGVAAKYPFQPGFPVTASGWVYLSSPAVADIDQDGQNELLIGAGEAVNGWSKTGLVLPGYPLITSDRYI